MIKRKFLRFAALLATVLLATCLLTGATTYPGPTNEFFVNDFANVISSADEQEIMQSAVALHSATKAQVVVVTVDSLGGEDIDTYTLGLAEQWGVGDEKTDTGVVLLLSISDREVKIEVGYGLEGVINDAKAGRMLDNYAMPYFKNNDFSTGLKNVYKAIVNEVYTEFNLEENIDEGYLLPEGDEREITLFDVICFVVALAIVIFVLIRNPGLIYFLAFASRGSHRSGGGFGSSGGGFSGGGGSFGGGGSSRRF